MTEQTHLDKIHLVTQSTERCYDVSRSSLFKIWSNYINSFLLCLLQTIFHFLSSGPIFLPKIPIDSGTFVVQTQSNYFFSTCFCFMRWGKNTSLTFPCDANLHHHETELICFTQLRRTPLDDIVIIHIHIDAETRLPERRDLVTLPWVTVTFAGLYYQRHFQTCFYHCSKHVLLRHHVKGCSTDIILPTVCWRCCRLASSYRFLAFHYQQILWLFARCLIQLDLIDIYHRLM